MGEQKEYNFNVDITIIAFNDNEADEIQKRIVQSIFEDEDVIQLYAEKIDESSTASLPVQ